MLKLDISYKVTKSWRILVFFRGFFGDYIFAWWNIWVSISGKAIVTHPLLREALGQIKQMGAYGGPKNELNCATLEA
jgi:hypothetical protein